MEGQAQIVDNSGAGAPTPDVTPAAPEAGAQAGEFQGQIERTPESLMALLDGADPATLFGQQQQPAAQPPVQEPAQAPPAQVPGQGMQVPDKFKNPDGSINTEALMKSYVGMEEVLGRQGNQLGQIPQLQQELQQLRAQLQPPAQAPPAQPEQAPEAPKFPWEDPGQDIESLNEEYFTNPAEANQKMLQKTIQAFENKMMNTLQEALKPITPMVQERVRQQEFQRQTNDFAEQINQITGGDESHEFFQLQPQMQAIVQQYGEAITKLPNAAEAIYKMAKGSLPSQPPAPTLEQMISDPAMVQKILAAPHIQAEARKMYVQDVKNGAPPIVMGGQGGGTPPASPSERPQSVREASAMFARSLR
jgi:hypothetical protein